MRSCSRVPSAPRRSFHVPRVRPAPVQLDLFRDRELGSQGSLQEARDLLASGQLESAWERYARVRARYPDSATIAHEAEILADLLGRMARTAGAPVEDRAAVLAGMADELAGASGTLARLRVALLERVAHQIEAERGPEVALSGHVPGHYFLQAGALERARESLERALARTRTARVLFAWADLAVSSGDAQRARAIYLEALVRNPFASALDRVRDAEVAALADVAKNEFDIADEPRAWCAPVGMVLRVLPNPAGERQRTLLTDALCSPLDDEPEARLPARAHALELARQFVRALHDAAICRCRDDLIAARRTMKRLQPGLFRAYLEHRPVYPRL
jgi:tetratricopeptide (TPR) repeat protein